MARAINRFGSDGSFWRLYQETSNSTNSSPLPNFLRVVHAVFDLARIIQWRFFPPLASGTKMPVSQKPLSTIHSESSGTFSHNSIAYKCSLSAYGPNRAAANRWLRNAVRVTIRNIG